MEEKKLTDEEIAKALMACSNVEDCCNNSCPLFEVGGCIAIMCKHAIELIHRLQSENATLESELKKELDEHEEFTKKAKAEIERLTEELKYYRGELQ